MAKTSKFKCPRCGNGLVKDGHTPGGRQRWACYTGRGGDRVQCYKTTSPGSKVALTQTPGKVEGPPPEYKRELRPVKRFIYTSAQNNTRVHPGFWNALLVAAKHFDAELIVLPYLYRNPTSSGEARQDEERNWFDDKLMPYLWNVRHKVNANLEVLGDISMQPTGSEPLSGLEGMTGAMSTIIGHPKLQMKTVPTPGHKMAKIMTTTGACTKDNNYSRTKTGKKGEFHHSLGALVVEVNGPIFRMRQLLADKSGKFIDLDNMFSSAGVRKAPRPAGMVLGDVHRAVHDPEVDRLRFGAHGVVETLRPRKIIWHDTHDGQAENPHEAKDPFIRFAKHHAGLNKVGAEVKADIRFIKERTPPFAQSLIVYSNHDDFLRRWVADTDWREDPTNAEFYLETALAMVRGARMDPSGPEYPAPFPYWVRKHRLPRVRCLELGESFLVAGIQAGMHGHLGPKGARGSRRNLRRIGEKSFIGHVHGPGIDEGSWSVGLGAYLNLKYAKGPSDWLQCDGLIHANGKRQLIIYVGGGWRE